MSSLVGAAASSSADWPGFGGHRFRVPARRGWVVLARPSNLVGAAAFSGHHQFEPQPAVAPICYSGISAPWPLIRNGQATSPASGQPKAGRIWRWSSTFTRGWWLAGHVGADHRNCSSRYQRFLSQYGLFCSMSAKGNCYDNACAESFFHSLKVEVVHGEEVVSRDRMRQVVFEYIEVDYNSPLKNGLLAPQGCGAELCRPERARNFARLAKAPLANRQLKKPGMVFSTD